MSTRSGGTSPTLRTDRLLLRPVQPWDVDGVLACATEEWARYLDLIVPFPYTRADAEAFVARCLQRDWRAAGPWFAIELRGTFIGSIDLSLNRWGGGDLGYSLAREHWGRGLITEAVREVITYGFGVLGLERIEAWADIRNVGSWRVMEKCGMVREGVFRSARPARDGSRSDDVHYAVLRAEWTRR